MGRSRSRGDRDRGGGGSVRKKGKSRSPSRERGRVRSWSRSQERISSKGGSVAARSKAADDRGPQVVKGGIESKPLKRIRKDVFERELGYKDESNPFGDSTLSDKFVWKKKNEYLAAAGLYKPSSKEQNVDRIEAKVREIHQVKKRRDEREVERKLLEQQRLEHDRDRHDEEYSEWLSREENFHLENAKARSLIRIDQGRERPIDLVAKGLAIAEGEDFEDMTILDTVPHQLFVTMPLADVEDCVGEIENFVKNDTAHTTFWKAMQYACHDAIESKQREKVGMSKPGAALSGLGAGVADGVVSEIHELLCSKSRKELEDMLSEIKVSLVKGGAGTDTQFFDAVATKIPLYIARAEIEDWHNKAKKRADKANEAKLLAEREAALLGADDDEEFQAPARKAATAAIARGEWEDLPDGPPSDKDDLSPELEPLSVLEESNIRIKGAYSPLLEPLRNYDPQELLDPLEDQAILRQVRQTIVEAFGGSTGASSSKADGAGGLDRSRDEEMLAAERSKGFETGEVCFNAIGAETGEITLPTRNYEWEDKYRPRKPRFFNRVKTGYEWNKYNQTHYDHDNPPPKMVQGYKFNIFYPDLINKSEAPKYYLEKDPASEETCILRFHAGPPYEDVAFKIVSREWNLSSKFGFRVVFDRGVLQLYFNFKRWRYRR